MNSHRALALAFLAACLLSSSPSPAAKGGPTPFDELKRTFLENCDFTALTCRSPYAMESLPIDAAVKGRFLADADAEVQYWDIDANGIIEVDNVMYAVGAGSLRLERVLALKAGGETVFYHMVYSIPARLKDDLAVKGRLIEGAFLHERHGRRADQTGLGRGPVPIQFRQPG